MPDLFVHLPPLTPVEARVLYGVLAAWCNGHGMDEPAWTVVNSLRCAVGEARDAQDVLKSAQKIIDEVEG
jgi:hypothetical protein